MNSSESLTDYKMSIYYPIIDIVLEELDRRFNKETFWISDSVVLLLNEKLSNFKINYLIKYCSMISIDYNLAIAEFSLIKHSLDLLYDYCEALNQISSSTYPNAYKLVKISKTLQIGLTECECFFSAIRRISNFLRTSMAQQRLSDFGILNIERNLVDLLSIEDIIK